MRAWIGAGLLAASLCGVALAEEPAAGPRLAVEPLSFDFGSVLSGKEVEKNFVLRNVGTEDVVIEAVTPTCGCTVVGEYDKTLKPGARTMVRLKLKTSAPGRVEKPVLIRWNDPAKQPIQLKLIATVTAAPAAAGQ
jgi:hypothetical protein